VTVIALLFGVVAHQAAANAQGPLVFNHVTVIDATGHAPKPDSAVVIAGERIIDMGEAKNLRVPKDAEVVNASGKFLIPGLCDMHVHDATSEYFGVPTDSMYRLYLANGVTCVRDSAVTITHRAQLTGAKVELEAFEANAAL